MKRIFETARPALVVTVMTAFTLLLSAVSAMAQAQEQNASVPEMRSRLLTTLTGYEITEYLKRNDVIFIPVGPTEVNGGNPTDVEYVIPLAYAMKLAEKGDGLVLPYLAYFYPGGTTSSPATVYMSTSVSLPYLKALTQSLIRQGFRRIIFLTSHGPSGNTMLPLVREIFDEQHVPVVWMDTGLIRPTPPPGTNIFANPPNPFEGGLERRRLVTYGAYQTVGRLDDMPVGLSEPEREFEKDQSDLRRFVPPFNGTPYGSFYSDPSEHGGFVTPVTAEQREEWGREGAALIESQVAEYDVNGMLEALRKHDEFTKQLEEVYGDLLPAAGN
jgi:creatinine amidohydrolase